MKTGWKSLTAVCVLVIGVYMYTAPLGALESLTLDAADTFYNSLIQGFRAGQLSLKKELPPGFAQLADPYDPNASSIYQLPPYRLSDLSYYKGRFYLYFGVAPALVLFWPFAALTGHYLSDRQAVVIFCTIGFLVSVGLVRAMWRRYLPEVRAGVVAVCALALGLATGVPALFPRSGVHEIVISCGYMLTMLTLGAIWRAWHDPERRCRWLVLASVAYGLAVGARPTLLFGAVVLLAPVAQSWPDRRQRWRLLLAAVGPIALVGLGLMLYNTRRFDSPFEFGYHYQLTGRWQLARQFFGLQYLWFNFRVYFLQPAHWNARFPFVNEITVPPLPGSNMTIDIPFGVLTNIPLVWLALAVPLAWRSQSGPTASILRWFVLGVALMSAVCALTLGFFESSAFRYEVDFLPTLVLLAVIGILGLERALGTPGTWLADRPVRRHAVRWGWGLLLAFSVAFNLLVSVKDYAAASCEVGTELANAGHVPEAIHVFKVALQITPDYLEARNNLGNALLQTGDVGGALEQYEQALRLAPGSAEAHYNLGSVLQQLGRVPEAIDQYQQALRIAPNYSEVHNNLGNALLETGDVGGATAQYEEAVRIKPDYAVAHYNLGNAMVSANRLEDAIEQYRQAVRIRPDYAEAQGNLGNALLQTGDAEEAAVHLREELRLTPGSAIGHYNLGNALLKLGRAPEAIDEFEQALRIKPDFVQARNQLARLRPVR